MKRDIELIIKILKNVEESDCPNDRIFAEIEGYDDSLVQYNVGLMVEVGLIEAINATSKDGIKYLIRNLTWSGHDFLDAARDQNVLNKAKEIARRQGAELSNLPLDIIKGLLLKAATELFMWDHMV